MVDVSGKQVPAGTPKGDGQNDAPRVVSIPPVLDRVAVLVVPSVVVVVARPSVAAATAAATAAAALGPRPAAMRTPVSPTGTVSPLFFTPVLHEDAGDLTEGDRVPGRGHGLQSRRHRCHAEVAVCLVDTQRHAMRACVLACLRSSSFSTTSSPPYPFQTNTPGLLYLPRLRKDPEPTRDCHVLTGGLRLGRGQMGSDVFRVRRVGVAARMARRVLEDYCLKVKARSSRRTTRDVCAPTGA